MSTLEYSHKKLKKPIRAIQYLGDKNKFQIVEFLKGPKFNVEFARPNEAQMKISINDGDYFPLYVGQWLIKETNGDIGVVSKEAFEEYYEQA